jgi:hypothetical protein
MHRHVVRTATVLAVALALGLGLSLVARVDTHAQGNGATIVRTDGDTCALETAPGVFEPVTCDNQDVYTPSGKIRSHASGGETTPPADGTADVTHEYPSAPVCSSTVSASGRVRIACHLSF